ncbi:murein L,D-transpeptidase family protein [Pseudooceanicola sp. HF7]|uniref:L,D-transpeptidase family protein n=1 Tax=Pseudooceanicola sp. HF7 TaxID=2721560 RepID=UPI001431120D|nr:L,D-transpeptidase family protein [Pseudooceanicola sp. HF7]NIZ09653.1 L,D-transpeptidase family protein [Pseudooceanicola sp. HF7]
MIRAVLILVLALTVAGCSSKFKTYNGPEVTRVYVFKQDRRMYLMHHDQVLKAYDIDLGNAPVGAKQFRGDGKTPEGVYHIDRRNPNSRYHLSVGISYPNLNDLAFAESQGKNAGGDIFIHGESQERGIGGGPDWTAGCIAVSDDEIEEIYSMLREGTVIAIFP